MQSDNQQILEFMSTHPLMVISTINPNGESESAVVGFGQTDSLQLIFGTDVNTRKSHNIAANPVVSVVIGWDAGGTIQYQGKARMLSGSESDEYAEIYFQKVPKSRRHKDVTGEAYFVIDPTWIRLTEVTSQPWKITEVTF
jgi:pyridoxine/pyridoxamine 5'-phosphate oxidase